jgi:LacI family transcriptional regulator
MKTQQDVASVAGVSVMTVSRVLRNRPGVTSATRAKVLRAIGEVGFTVPPSLGSWQIQRRSGRRAPTNIVLLTGGNPEDWPMEGAWTDVLAAALNRVVQSDAAFDVLVMSPQTDMTPDRVDKALRTRGVSGVLFGPGLATPDLERLTLSHYALVALDLAAQDLAVDRVTIERIALMDEVFRMATNSGARRPALITGARPLLRESLWTTAFEEAQCFLLPPSSRIAPFAAPADAGRIAEWVRHNRPDFIFSSLATVFEAARDGRLLPAQQFCGLDLPPAFLGDRFSGTYPPMKQIAITAVDLMLSKADRGAFGPGTHPKVMLKPSQLHLASGAPPWLATMKIPIPHADSEIDPIEFDLMADVLGQ